MKIETKKANEKKAGGIESLKKWLKRAESPFGDGVRSGNHVKKRRKEMSTERQNEKR